MNSKGQVASIIVFFAIVIGIFILSIILLKVTNTILTPFQANIGNMSAKAGADVSYIQNKFVTWWDWVIILVFLLNALLLFVSVFLVDVHPAFLFLYILAVLFLMIFGSVAQTAVEKIWTQPDFATEAGQMPLTQYLINNLGIVILIIIVLSGILMYAKIKYFTGTGGGY